MSANPYAAPSAELRDPEDEVFSFSIAVTAMLIATGIAYVAGIVYGNLTQWVLLSRGTAVNQLYNAVATSPFFNLGAHVINVFAAAAGGYWAAKRKPKRASAHAAAAGALMLFPVAVAWITPYDMPHPRWSVLLTFITPIPSAVLGVFWWRRRA